MAGLEASSMAAHNLSHSIGSCRLSADSNSEMAVVLSRTELMAADFHEKEHLSLLYGQAPLDMLKLPDSK